MNALALTTNSIAQQASPPADDAVIAMWLHGRSPHTRRAYESDIAKLRTFCRLPLAAITLKMLQDFSDSLACAPASKHRTLCGIKSLFKFAHGLGYLPFNTAHALIIQKISARVKPNRILTEAQVKSIIDLETNPRNKAILILFYSSGIRVAELRGLRWSDCQPRNNTGQITVTGKRNKIREILLPAWAWHSLMSLRTNQSDDHLIVNLISCSIWRIVRAAAIRANIKVGVSPHWLRHSFASHAAHHRVSLPLLQQTLGHASIRTTELYLHAQPEQSVGDYLNFAP